MNTNLIQPIVTFRAGACAISREIPQIDTASFLSSLSSYFLEIYRVGLKITQQELTFTVKHQNLKEYDIKALKLESSVFWQFTKLPKIVSDRLFSCFAIDSLLSYKQFLNCFEILTLGNMEQKLYLVFKMLDFNDDKAVTPEDCRVILNEISTPQSTVAPGFDLKLKQHHKIQELISATFPKPRLNFAQFYDLYANGETQIANSILLFLHNQLQILRKVAFYANGELDSITIKRILSSFETCLVKVNEQAVRVAADYEGRMYRELGKDKLKIYYYRLVGSQLYVYRHKDDRQHKQIIYVGHGSYLKSSKSKFMSSKEEEMYSFEVISPSKSRKFYHITLQEFYEWRRAILIATGNPVQDLQEKYEIGETLGQGKYGLVKKAVERTTSQEFAVKIIAKGKMRPDQIQSLRLEIEIMKKLKHPHIVSVHQVYQTMEQVFIVMELLQGGDLHTHLKTFPNKKMPEDSARQIIHQVAMALYYLKSEGVLHRDLKPQNIMLSGDLYQDTSAPEVKIMDFGLSTVIGNGETAHQPFGTLTYVAPQILYDQPYDFKVDMYSLGSMMYQLLCGHLPFNVRSEKQMVVLVTQKEPSFKGEEFASVSTELIKLAKDLLEKDPRRRLSIEDVLRRDSLVPQRTDLAVRRQNSSKTLDLSLFASAP